MPLSDILYGRLKETYIGAIAIDDGFPDMIDSVVKGNSLEYIERIKHNLDFWETDYSELPDDELSVRVQQMPYRVLAALIDSPTKVFGVILYEDYTSNGFPEEPEPSIPYTNTNSGKAN
tara:strand:- start:2104 stop:2460 length:357 start_codon:yes stop_codon:yes gene_type:complete